MCVVFVCVVYCVYTLFYTCRPENMSSAEKLVVTEMAVAARLSSPVVNTTISTNKINFSRSVCMCFNSVHTCMSTFLFPYCMCVLTVVPVCVCFTW